MGCQTSDEHSSGAIVERKYNVKGGFIYCLDGCGKSFVSEQHFLTHTCVPQGEPWPAPSGLTKESFPQNANVTIGSSYGAPISKEELLAYRKRLFAKLDEVLIAKGSDYNSQQQEKGDTLFNLRTCAILGIVPCPEDGILVRLSDKLMRLVSLTRPGTVQKVKDESIEDTAGDAINYLTYLLAMRLKMAGKL